LKQNENTTPFTQAYPTTVRLLRPNYETMRRVNERLIARLEHS